MNEFYIGIDLGGTNIKIGCFGAGLGMIARTTTSTQKDADPETIVETMALESARLVRDAGLSFDDIRAVGIGSPGPLDQSGGVVVAIPTMPRFRNVPLRKMLGDRLGKPVVMERDANAAAWGERVAGAGKGVNDMALLTLGTGIGGGIISNGRLVRGFGDDAGELGHIIIFPEGHLCDCGQRGCAEAYASANSTVARAHESLEKGADSTLKNVLAANGAITARDIYEHAERGDPLALDITGQTAEVLGILCVNLLHATYPQKILFGGGMAEAGEFLLEGIRRHFRKRLWRVRDERVEICRAALGPDAGIVGSAALAVESHLTARRVPWPP